MKYDCWIPEYGQVRGDNPSIEETHAQYAAQKSIRDYERRNAEYTVAADGMVVVMVCPVAEKVDARAKTYIVTGWTEPMYSARLKI